MNTCWGRCFDRVGLLEFDRARKMMSVVVARSSGANLSGRALLPPGGPFDGNNLVMFTKGAPESVLSRCTHVLSDR